MPPLHILGAGSIGLLSAHLLRQSHLSFPIYLIRRTPRTPGKVGVSVQHDNKVYEVEGVYEDDPLTPIHQLLITTKAHQTRPAVHPLLSSSRLSPSTLYVFLQNGLHVHAPLLPLLPSPQPQVVLGTTTHGVFQKKEEKDTICWVARGKTLLAPTPGTILTPTQKEWLSALGELTSFSTLEDFLFKKVALNSCINPVTALFHIKNGGIVEDKNSKQRNLEIVEDQNSKQEKLGPWDWVVRLAQETREVLKNERPQLDLSGLEEEVASLAFQTKDNINSMLADVKSGNETEIEFINGAIVELGKKHGVATPWHEDIIQQIKQLRKL